MKEIIDKLTSLELKTSALHKTIIKRNRHTTDEENIFAEDTSNKGPLTKI